MSQYYAESGVNLEAGYESVERIKKHVAKTHNKGVMSMIGSFGACFDLSAYQFKNPVLVSGTDGVGTKLKLAFMQDIHHTIGEDVVAMCVNDVLAQGAIPLYFLDYIAVSKNNPRQIEDIVAGVANGCVKANCALIGGETAEMAGFYEDGEYDIAGFCVGANEKERLMSPANTKAGQIVIGIKSSGVHSNGYSLVRKIIKDHQLDLNQRFEDTTLGEVLLRPTRIYVAEIMKLMESIEIKGMAHITGGGFFENLPRCLDKGLGMSIDTSSYEVPEIFNFLQTKASIPTKEMYNIFNMGVGFVVVVEEKDVEFVLGTIKDSFVLGEVVDREGIELR